MAKLSKRTLSMALLFLLFSAGAFAAHHNANHGTVGIIGTGDTGDSLARHD